jgi:predicted permease
MNSLWKDLRYSIGSLRRNPGYAATIILSIALGVGANSTIFAALDTFLLRSLPVKNPQELVQIATANPVVIGIYDGRSQTNTYSYPLYRDLRANNRVFSDLICRSSQQGNLSYLGRAERVAVEFVSENYFDMLGVGAALGRLLTSRDESTAANQPAVVLSHRYWKNHLGGDPSVLGQALLLSGRTVTVVGVASARFHGLELGHAPDLYVPVSMGYFYTGFGILQNRRHIWLQVMGRLQNGITMEQAQKSLNPLFHQILGNEVREMGPEISNDLRQKYARQILDLQPGSQGVDYLQKRSRSYLGMLSTIVLAVLLIACANAAAIQLAQSVRRRKEIALRISLGASRGRLIRLLLTESFILALLGGAASLVVASLMLDGLNQMVSIFQPLEEPIALNLHVLGFTALLSLGSALVFGLAPALHALRVDILPMLRNEGPVHVSKSHTMARRVLVVGQIALSTLLLIVAGLFMRTLLNLQRIDPGFAHQNVLRVQINPASNQYSPERTKAVAEALEEHVRSIPGVKTAVLTSHGILTSAYWSSIKVDGFKPRKGENAAAILSSIFPGENTASFWSSVAPGYFSSLGIPIMRGRDFSNFDTRNSMPVAIVNEAFAHAFFPNQEIVGKSYMLPGNPPGRQNVEIVGMVGNAAFLDLRDKTTPFYFMCVNQKDLGFATLLVKTEGDSLKIAQAIRQEMFAIDPALPLWEIKTLDAQIKEDMAPERLFAVTTGIFGGMAMVLAATGIFGLLSFLVAQRTREIGVRMALGAERGGIVSQVLRQTMMLTAIGLSIGLCAAFIMSRYLRSMLFDVQPIDPPSLALAILVIAATALAAALFPASRAAAVDPMDALRHE